MRLRIKHLQEEPCTSTMETRSSRNAANTATPSEHLPYLDSSGQSSPKQSPVSPHSPVGRVAKRNARLLSGLDLGPNSSNYPEHLVGTIPDFSIRRIQEVCPALVRALDAQEEDPGHVLEDGTLTDLQFQLENLLADNVDWQKNIFGEMTFLSTGDYPTDDLHSRLMPSFELRDDHTATHRMESDDPQPSISYIDHYKQDEDDAGSDVVSSMDEKEAEEPYCVLDIPHRFWTWVREYIGHIDEKFLRDFDQNFYQRFQPEQLDEFFINEPFKYKPTKQKDAESPKHHKHLNGQHTQSSGRKDSKTMNGNHHIEEPSSPSIKRRSSVQSSRDQFIKSLKSEESAGEWMKRLVAAYIKDQIALSKNAKRGRKPLTKERFSPKLSTLSSSSKRQKQKSGGRKSKNGEINGKVNGHLNGVDSTDDEAQNDFFQNSDLMESIGKALADCVMPVGATNGMEHDMVESETDESEEEEIEVVEDYSTPLSNNMENFEMIKLKLDSKHKVEDLDEVSTELLKAQQRLEHLVKKTSPILSKCKKELEAEHAHWVTSRALNSIDDELFRLTNQIPAGATQPPKELFKRCLDTWEERKRYLLSHYIRDHVKFVQYVEKSNKDAQKIEAVMGISATPNSKRAYANESATGTKTRSNRKKTVKRELYPDTVDE